MMWRDTKDEEMGLTQLADGLRIDKKEELADYVLDTLECKIIMHFTWNTYPYFSAKKLFCLVACNSFQVDWNKIDII